MSLVEHHNSTFKNGPFACPLPLLPLVSQLSPTSCIMNCLRKLRLDPMWSWLEVTQVPNLSPKTLGNCENECVFHSINSYILAQLPFDLVELTPKTFLVDCASWLSLRITVCLGIPEKM